ncbi:uncharacterized protein Os04g0629400-like [Triticum urartu]|uniref:uncharacterized protein Os04g0629400-like n=1 Tax=Triticum urartu TaxID=4572 RepID=UPI0020442B86|nr:uncharacterized protein Os04g0629400-like [Triticum urartu]
MCCYVGKATKIFLCLVTAVLLAGLVLGFGLAHRTLWGGQKAEPACRWPRCQQQQPGVDGGGGPLPVAGTTTNAPPSNPLTEPAVAVFPGVASSTAAEPPATASVPYYGPPRPFPGVASSTAVPPAVTSVPYFAPPSPFPGAASSTAVPPAPNFGPPSPFPGVASSAAVPPAPHFGPPSPFTVGLGPSSHP